MIRIICFGLLACLTSGTVDGQTYPSLRDSLIEIWRLPLRLSTGVVHHECKVIRNTCQIDSVARQDNDVWAPCGEYWFAAGQLTSVVNRYRGSERWTYDSLRYDRSGRLSEIISFRHGSEARRILYEYTDMRIKATVRSGDKEQLLQEYVFDEQGSIDRETTYSSSGRLESLKKHVYEREQLEAALRDASDSSTSYVLHDALKAAAGRFGERTVSIQYYNSEGKAQNRSEFIYDRELPVAEIDYVVDTLVRLLVWETSSADEVVLRELIFDPEIRCVTETLHRYHY